MNALVVQVRKAYEAPIVTNHTESLVPHLPRLRKEIEGNHYVLPELQTLLQTAVTMDVFQSSTIELRVIGGTKRDHWLCKKVCRRASAVQSLYPSDPQKLVVWIFLTDAKRFMPVHGHIEPKHINGGYTYIPGPDIFVLRREEFPKVVLHEIIHHTRHHRKHWSAASLTQLYDTFHISKHQCDVSMDACSTILEPNEAVVECWAEMLHLIFVAKDTNIPYTQLLKSEQENAFQQTKKLLHHQFKHVQQWQEGSHSYSYIVLRTLLLYSFADWALRSPPLDSDMLTAHIMTTWRAVQERLRKTKQSSSNSLRMTCLGDF